MTIGESSNVVVTGATGFIGRSCCKCLVSNGFDVIRVGRSKADDIYCDLMDPDSVWRLSHLPAYKAFIHLGAHVGLDGSILEDMYVPNVLSTALIADITRKRDAQLVFASTAIIAGLNTERISALSEPKPDTPYAQSKELAEQCLRASGVASAILRIGGVYGPNGPQHLGLNRTLQEALAGNPPVIFGDGSGKRNYIYVNDLALLLVRAVMDRVMGTHLVSGSEELSISQMYHSICDVFKIKGGPRFLEGDSSRSQIMVASPSFSGQSLFTDSLEAIKSGSEFSFKS